MNQKPFDHMDDQFREAAENFQPPFNREGWEKMELLLDKSGRKRRPVFWFWPLLLVLIVGGGGVYIFRDLPGQKTTTSEARVVNPVEKSNEETEVKTSQKPKPSVSAAHPERKAAHTPDPSAPVSSNVGEGKQITSNTSTPDTRVAVSTKMEHIKGETPRKDRPAASVTGKAEQRETMMRRTTRERNVTETSATPKRSNREVNDDINIKQSSGIAQRDAQQSPADNDDKKTSQGQNQLVIPDTAIADDKSVAVTKPDQDSAVSSVNPPDSAKLTETKKPQIQVPSGLYYTVSLAADGNALKPISADQFTMRYGVGIGYQMNRRWSIQTGLFGSQKNYSAGGKDYYFKPGSYYDTVNMKYITAACYVIEIPLAARYNIVQRKRSSVYGVVGLSSYIMKKETYDYYYTYHNTWPASPRVATHTYTGNKHFFSVFDLSLGFERRLSPMFSLQAEPYLKIPLAGVGEGKVHLYSTGLQLSFKWQRMKTVEVGSR